MSLKTSAIPGKSVPEAAIKLQHRLHTHLDSCSIDVAGKRDVFGLIRTLLSVVADHRNHAAIRKALCLPALSDGAERHEQFEHARWEHRVGQLETVANWISQWPESFHIGADAAHLTQRAFARRLAPTDLASEIGRLPEGRTRKARVICSIVDAQMRRLRRTDPRAFREIHASRLLRAAGYYAHKE
jgi:hypothetical protein